MSTEVRVVAVRWAVHILMVEHLQRSEAAIREEELRSYLETLHPHWNSNTPSPLVVSTKCRDWRHLWNVTLRSRALTRLGALAKARYGAVLPDNPWSDEPAPTGVDHAHALAPLLQRLEISPPEVRAAVVESLRLFLQKTFGPLTPDPFALR